MSDNSGKEKELQCQWMEPPCHERFQDPEDLFRHLCDAHVGRKSQGTLTLKCAWSQCQITCAKRDHITSHMRVHTPLKPHACTTCNKAFKRPQDLRKHEKIHTEEHHVRHKQSKAITIPSTNKTDANASSITPSTENQKSPPPQAANAANQGQQPIMPYMLPYPYSYMTSPEQQAGLAELFLQQQRLNAAAAQLMGLPPHLQQVAAMQQAQAAQQSPFGSASFPGGAASAALMMPGLFPNFGQLPAGQSHPSYNQQQIPPSYAGLAALQLGANLQGEAKSASLYPNLNELLGRAENTQSHTQPKSTSRASSSTAPSPGSSSHQYSSVSPHPPHQQQQAAYSNVNGNHYDHQSTAGYTQPIPLQPVAAHGRSHATSGKGNKRSFNDEADSLLADLKKKRFDPADNAIFDHRLDALSSYLFSSDGSLSDSFVSSVPSAILESTQSPSDGSSHSSSSNFSPRSASGSVRSPLDGNIEISKSDIDDINTLLFSFGQPYDSPAIPDNKDVLQWPASAPSVTSINSNLDYSFSTPYEATQNSHTDQHQQRSLQTASNGHLYPSLADLSQHHQQASQQKPIKPLPSHRNAPQQAHPSQHSHQHPHLNRSPLPSHSTNGYHPQQYQQNHGFPSVSFDGLAPSRAVPTPYISSDHNRDPIMTSVPLLSRAPPLAPLLSNVNLDTEQQEQSRRAKQGVSSLRSTVEDEEMRDSPEPMSEGEQEERNRFHANERARYTLPPMINRADQRGTECHLPSLRSLLNEPISSPNASPTLSTTSSSYKRHTPSRQFYPSLTSFSDDTHRPSTSDRLDHVLRGVNKFRLNSMDDYQDDAEETSSVKSESDDDLGPDAVYKRSRLRTRSPPPSQSPVSPSECSSLEEDSKTRLPSIDEEERESIEKARIVRTRRLAVIRALVARANELYRSNLATKANHPALVRVKEESMD